MEPKTILFDIKTFVITKKQSKISRKSIIKGLKHIRVDNGCVIQAKVTLRGDLEELYFGSNVIIKDSSIIKPSFTQDKGKIKY